MTSRKRSGLDSPCGAAACATAVVCLEGTQQKLCIEDLICEGLASLIQFIVQQKIHMFWGGNKHTIFCSAMIKKKCFCFSSYIAALGKKTCLHLGRWKGGTYKSPMKRKEKWIFQTITHRIHVWYISTFG